MKILASTKSEKLQEALNSFDKYAVVEAEYGSVEVLGSSDALTLNHHVRLERLCPCLYENMRVEVDVIGISHCDLDTLGGVLAVQGRKPEAEAFWKLAAFVDVSGPHRIRECDVYSEELHQQLAAFWVWVRDNRLNIPRDGTVIDATDYIEQAAEVLDRILNGDDELLRAGKTFLADEEKLRRESFVGELKVRDYWIVLRSADSFVNHLYYRFDGEPAHYVVGYNTKMKTVTVSKADKTLPVNMCEIVQREWGDRAGGHAVIAGGPRDGSLSLLDAYKIFGLLSLEVFIS